MFVCYNHNDMKYNKFKFTKLICILLACALVIPFSACGDDEIVESSAPEAESSLTETVPALSFDEAVALLERDKTVTDIFINNSLCDKSIDSAEKRPVSSSSEYSNYLNIISLLTSTYTESGGYAQKFMSYPEGHTPAVSGDNNQTYVFYHEGSEYTDSVLAPTASVSDTENETEKIITAQTRMAKTVEFKAVYENGKWLLEKGIYSFGSDNASESIGVFPLSDKGSLSEFSGDVLVIQLFVSDKVSSFTAEEEQSFRDSVETAVERITSETRKYGIEANITYESAYFEHEATIGTRALDFDIVFAETGFGSLEAFAEANYKLALYDNYVFVVCMNKELEVSCEGYADTPETEIYYGERVIIGAGAAPQEICVSFFKLLGAYGYDSGKCDEYTESLYRAYFPDDIMLSADTETAVVSPVTAYACGFTDVLDPLYRVFLYE